MSAVQGLPTIEEVHAKFSPALPSEQVVDHSTGLGGTTSAPIEKLAVAAEVKEVAEVPTETVEAPAEEPKKEEPKQDTSASRFAALARREKEARARESAAETRVKEAEARAKALEERDSKWARIKQNPLEALKEAGLTLSDIVNASYGKYEAPALDPVDEKLRPFAEKASAAETQAQALAKQVEELRQQLALKDQSEQYDRVMGGISTELRANTDKYELINAFGQSGADLVRDTMVEYWKVNQKVLDYSEACDIVEKHYESEYLERLSKTKKLSSRFAGPAGTNPAPKATSAQKPKEPSATLTNKMANAPQANIDIDKMSKTEAIAYLSKKLQFTDD